jgi:hypothetical protein
LSHIPQVFKDTAKEPAAERQASGSPFEGGEEYYLGLLKQQFLDKARLILIGWHATRIVQLEGRKQRAENRGQRTEIGIRKWEGGIWNDRA